MRRWSSVIPPCLAFLERGEIFLWMLCASTHPCSLVRVAHEALVLSGCLGHTLDLSRRFFISRCTSRGTKHHGHVEVIDNVPGVLREELRTTGTWR
jgi:hypothetical protein